MNIPLSANPLFDWLAPMNESSEKVLDGLLPQFNLQ